MERKCTLFMLLILTAMIYPDIALADNNFIKTMITCNVSGETLKLESYKNESGSIYLTLSRENIETLCVCLGGILSKKEGHVAFCINKNGNNIILDPYTTDNLVIMLEEKDNNKLLLIKLDYLIEMLGGKVTYDSSQNMYYIQHKISQILATEENNELTLKILATSNIKFSTKELQSPRGIVITINDVYLDPGAKIPDNQMLKGMLIEQLHNKPGSLSITIPLDKDTTVYVKPRILPQEVVVKIRKNINTTAKTRDSIVCLNNISIEDNRDYVKILVNTSAPFDYRWSRLRPPDNRFFLDFLNTTLEAPCTSFEPENCIVNKIRAIQLQAGLEEITRLVLDLNHPAECEIIIDYDNPRQLIILCRNQLIDPENAVYYGYGSTTQSYSEYGHIICIDPGHGGSDRGAYNHNIGLAEKDVTLDISMRLAEILKKRGYAPILTRSSDRDVTYAGSPDREELAARNKIAEQNNAILFVSIHINASVNKNANGISTHWYKSKDRDLAQEIQNQLIQKTGRKDRGIHRDRFFVLRNTEIPSVLVEAGFISYDEEAYLLCNEEYLQRIAEAIADGLGIYIARSMNKRSTVSIGNSSKK